MLSEMAPQATPIYQLNASYKLETLASEATTLDSDLHKAVSLKEFAEELQQFAKRNRIQLPPQKTDSRLPISGFVRQGHILSALRRCMENAGYWSSEGLRKLLEDDYVMPGYDDDIIFQCIIKYKSFDLYKFISQTFPTVANKHIVNSFKSILHGVVVEERIKSLHRDGYFGECPVPEQVLVNISYVMSLPVDVASLKDYLKLLTVDDAILLLQCFVFMLHVVSPALEKDLLKSALFDGQITERRIIVWMDLILSAHLMALSNMSDVERLMSDITLCIQKQELFYNELSELEILLQHFQDNKKPQKYDELYSIETITL